MSTLFPSMPSNSPCSPEEDGLAHVHIGKDGVTLDFGDHTVLIPNSTISKNGIVIKPGSPFDDVNRVHVELIASNVTIGDDAPMRDVRVYP